MKRTSKKYAKAATRQTNICKKQAKRHKKQLKRQCRRAKLRATHRTITMKTSAKKGITAQAGLVPVMKYLNNALHFRKVAEGVVEFVRGANATYPLVDMLQLVMLGVIGGANALSELVSVCADIVFVKVDDWNSIPHHSVLGRLFRTIRERHIAQLETLVHRLRPCAWKYAKRKNSKLTLPRRSMWIDCDSTEDVVYGHQEGAEKGYNTKKKGALSYHPLLAFCVATKEILQGWFRCGSAYTRNGVVEFMKQLAAHLPPTLRLVFRGDSGFFVGALFDWLDARGDGYLVKAKLYQNLKACLLRQSWVPVKGQSGWEQCEFMYHCDTWKTTRRFVAVRQALDSPPAQAPKSFLQAWLPGLELLVPVPEQDSAYFCYVTTESLTPWEAHTRYGQRATCETWIEEAKNQMGLGHIRTSEFLANAAFFQCAVLAYNVLRWMALCTCDEMLRRSEPNTIRRNFIRIAGTVTFGARGVVVTTAPNLFPEAWESWLAIVDL